MARAQGPHEIRFGNPLVHEAEVEAGFVRSYKLRQDLGKRVTTFELPQLDAKALIDGCGKIEKAVSEQGLVAFVTHVLSERILLPHEVGVKHMLVCLKHHAHGRLDWVSCEDEKLRHVLSLISEAPEGEDTNYTGTELAPIGGGSPEWDRLLALTGGDESRAWELAREIHRQERMWPGILAGLDGELTALKTSEGFETMAKQVFGTSAQGAQFKYMAVSKNATAPSEGNTSLSEENTTAEGGLLRRETTYGYTGGTHKATSAATFTANKKDTEEAGAGKLPYKIHKFGLFNKVTSGGVMGVETEITEAVISAEGDNTAITDTIELK